MSEEVSIVRINELEKRYDREFNHIRDLIRQSELSSNKALDLQAKEYERRLDALNGEAGRIAKIQNDFVPKGEYVINLDSLKTDIDVLKNYKSNLEGRIYAIVGMIGFILTLINIGIKFLPSK